LRYPFAKSGSFVAARGILVGITTAKAVAEMNKDKTKIKK